MINFSMSSKELKVISEVTTILFKHSETKYESILNVTFECDKVLNHLIVDNTNKKVTLFFPAFEVAICTISGHLAFN